MDPVSTKESQSDSSSISVLVFVLSFIYELKPKPVARKNFTVAFTLLGESTQLEIVISPWIVSRRICLAWPNPVQVVK